MSDLSTLNTAKSSEYDTRLATKRRRLVEISENELLQIVTQCVQLFYGEIYGNAAVATAAKAALEELYDDTITLPASQVGATPTELNTRRGKGVVLTAGLNTITFTSAISSADYTLIPWAYTATGGQIQISIDPALCTVNGFQIYSASAGRLNYFAILN